MKGAEWVLMTDGQTLPKARAQSRQNTAPLTGLVPRPVRYWVCGGGGGSELGRFVKETVSWMLVYYFGGVHGEVKGAVLARETVVSCRFRGLSCL